MQLRLAVFVVVMMAVAGGTAAPAHAITFGQPDGTLHPNVGGLLADWNPDSPGPDLFCSGTLVDKQIFLTAAHCTSELERRNITELWVTFDPVYDEDAAFPSGIWKVDSWVSHELFGRPGLSDAHDIAVAFLEDDPGIAPAKLPKLGLLDEMSQQVLRGQTFTAVGYGTTRTSKSGGFKGILDNDQRMYALQSMLSLQPAWLNLSMQPSTGDGGTCYGDSGGPHFLGGVTSDLVVSITITGDAVCRATDKTYRLDSHAAQEFLSRFGLVPAP